MYTLQVLEPFFDNSIQVEVLTDMLFLSYLFVPDCKQNISNMKKIFNKREGKKCSVNTFLMHKTMVI